MSDDAETKRMKESHPSQQRNTTPQAVKDCQARHEDMATHPSRQKMKDHSGGA